MNSRLFLTTLAISAAAAAPAAAKPADVNVVNTVTVAGTVGLDPAANGVTITNQAPIPVTVAQPHAPAERVVVTSDVTIPAGETSASEVILEVPEGKRFESDFIQATSFALDGQFMQMQAATRYRDVIESGVLPLQPAEHAGSRTNWIFAGDFTLVADRTVTFFLTRSGGTAQSVSGRLTIVGRLLDESAPAS